MTQVNGNNVFKIMVAVLLGLICYVSMIISVGAFNAQNEAKVISSNPENIYTLYVGMSRADVEANFSDVKGWTAIREPFSYTITRNYSRWDSIKAGANLTQYILVQFDPTGHVYSIMADFYTDSMRLADTIYNTMYNTLLAKYGNPHKNEKSNRFAYATWLANNHVYSLQLVAVKGGVKTYLLVGPIHKIDY